MQFGQSLADGFLVGDDIEPPFGGYLLPVLGDQRRFVGLHRAGDVDDALRDRHFQI